MSLFTFMNGGTATQLRGLLWFSLSDTGQVGKRTSTSDSGGGASQTWAYGPAVPCRLDPVVAIGGESIVAGRLDDRSSHTITVPAGTSVSRDDRFSINGRGTFEVTAIRDRTGQPALFFEAVQVS